MIIAIDFDGTCVTHRFPEVGEDIGAVPVLRKLVEAGHQLILYTMRSHLDNTHEFSGGLRDAINWFSENNIPLYGIHQDPAQSEWTSSPKCWAQIYIDDCGLGIPLIYPCLNCRPYVDWVKVKEMLHERGVL